MEPEYDMPEPPPLAPDEIPVPDVDAFAPLNAEAEESRTALEHARRQLVILKELHNATVAAFREELQRAARERIVAETDLAVYLERAKAQLLEASRARTAEAQKWRGRFVALFNALHKLTETVGSCQRATGTPAPGSPADVAIVEAREVLAVAAEYLD